jgi:glutamate/tyrosine decarboxylase-like PLP-dependent enzyme
MIRSENKDEWIRLLSDGRERLEQGFAGLPEYAPSTSAQSPQASAVMAQVASRLTDNYPYFHPLYAGQMLKPPHPVAQAAYALAMTLNPNNHARDGGRASSTMEIEAVAEIAQMFGWGGAGGFLGHLTSGGTFANLEALWVSGQLAPGKRVLASEQAHYTHKRITAVLGIPFDAVRSDDRGRMDLNALEDELRRGNVGTVVATLGTTALGAVDPLAEILALRERYGFRIHVDAAYGGYFRLIRSELGKSTAHAYEAIEQADSIVVDPHKHGLQPYGCGCVLFRDAGVGRFYKHDSPYTYFTSSDLHLGEISLECSRAGAAAVALWATQKLLPLVRLGEPEDEFARGLAAGRRAAMKLDRRLREDQRFSPLPCAPELDIVVWRVCGESNTAQQIFEACDARGLHLALVQLPGRFFGAEESEMVQCLRSVLMKPEHEAWLPEIWRRLSVAAER